MPHHILLLNGPNLNLLGKREPEVYGKTTLLEIENGLAQESKKMNIQFSAFQSQSEAALIEKIHQAHIDKVDFILFNPASLTHTSIALRDALLAVAIPFIEIHISNVYQREAFRHTSYFSDIAKGCIIGLGTQGYQLAILAARAYLQDN
ncbi:MAG: type II 3-dehydroquinate dehydratase [Pseudomonadota bacterium]